jgi:hypothetical protein
MIQAVTEIVYARRHGVIAPRALIQIKESRGERPHFFEIAGGG